MVVVEVVVGAVVVVGAAVEVVVELASVVVVAGSDDVHEAVTTATTAMSIAAEDGRVFRALTLSLPNAAPSRSAPHSVELYIARSEDAALAGYRTRF